MRKLICSALLVLMAMSVHADSAPRAIAILDGRAAYMDTFNRQGVAVEYVDQKLATVTVQATPAPVKAVVLPDSSRKVAYYNGHLCYMDTWEAVPGDHSTPPPATSTYTYTPAVPAEIHSAGPPTFLGNYPINWHEKAYCPECEAARKHNTVSGR